MTKTSLPVLAILAAFAVQACAAPTSDDASSDPMTNAESAVEQARGETNEASKLSGAFGTPSEATTLAGAGAAVGGEMKAGHAYPATLFVKSKNVTYDVVAYDFGIEGARADMTGATRSFAPASLMPLSIVIAHDGSLPSLAQDALSGVSIGEIVLSQLDASGKPVELARFDGATVLAAHTAVGGDVPHESVAFGMKSMRVSKAGNWVKFDATTGEATTSSSLLCGDRLGAYTQSLQSSLPIAKGSTRIDAIQVGVSNDPMGRASLDTLGFSGALETGGLCSITYAARASAIPTVRLGVAAASQTSTTGPREAITWEACRAAVANVRFSTRWDGTTEAVQLSAAGLVRTDRSWSWDGKVTETTNGWSFVTDAKIASCGDVQ